MINEDLNLQELREEECFRRLINNFASDIVRAYSNRKATT